MLVDPDKLTVPELTLLLAKRLIETGQGAPITEQQLGVLKGQITSATSSQPTEKATGTS